MEVTAVDDQGNAISSAYEATEVGPGITVRRDSTFLPVFVNDSQLSVAAEAPTMRFVVTADNYGATSFKLGTGETTVTIPVQVIAQNVLAVQASNVTPVLNEVVTLTAPAGVSFSPTTTVTFTGAVAQPADVVVAADGKSLTFLPPPNILNAPAVLTDVVSDATPGVTFAPSTDVRFTTPAITVFDGTVSNLTPALGEPVTVTFNGATFDPATAVFQIGADTVTLVGATPNVATLIPPPGATGLLLVNGLVIDTINQFALNLTNAVTDTMTVGTVAPPIANTDDINTAPTVTAPSAFPTVVFDSSSFTGADITGDGGVGAQYYKFTVAATDTINVSVASDNGGADLDLIVCGDAACNTAPLVAATTAFDEGDTAEFLPGTYFIAVVNFDGGATTSIKLILAPSTIE